jgi:hypothetical protein
MLFSNFNCKPATLFNMLRSGGQNSRPSDCLYLAVAISWKVKASEARNLKKKKTV